MGNYIPMGRNRYIYGCDISDHDSLKKKKKKNSDQHFWNLDRIISRTKLRSYARV